jgi:glutaredoxin-related protein
MAAPGFSMFSTRIETLRHLLSVKIRATHEIRGIFENAKDLHRFFKLRDRDSAVSQNEFFLSIQLPGLRFERKKVKNWKNWGRNPII